MSDVKYDPELCERLLCDVAIVRQDMYAQGVEEDQRLISDLADQLEAARREVDSGNDKLRRLYNAMCAAMANWERPDPGDRNLSDAEWERVGKAQEAAWHEMKAVFDASPGVLYVDTYRAAKSKAGT